MADEVFKNSVENLCRKNCERVPIITHSLCKNVLRVCGKEESPLPEPSPFCTSNQTGWRNDVCLNFFFHLGVLNPINLDSMTWRGWQWWITRWHITYQVQLLSQCLVSGQHTDWLRSHIWEPDVKSQDKSKIPGCAERCRAAVGENGMWAPCVPVTLRFDSSTLRVWLCNKMLQQFIYFWRGWEVNDVSTDSFVIS